MRIGEVAAEAGVNVQTVRYYERRGLLDEPGRTPSGYREYAADAARRVRFIKRAQELGFTLGEIAGLLALRDGGQSGPDARGLAVAKVEDIELKIRRLVAMRAALATLVDNCACDSGAPTCAILEALDDSADKKEGRSKDVSVVKRYGARTTRGRIRVTLSNSTGG